MLSVIISVEREEFVALEAPVHADAQIHVLGMQRGNAETNLQTSVLHRTEVGQKTLVGEGRYRHVVEVEHVAGFRVVIVDGQGDALFPEGEVETDIEGLFDFPFQVGVGIADDTQRGDISAPDGYYAIGLNQLHGVIGVDTPEITGMTIANTQLGIRYEVGQVHPFFLTDNPGTTNGGEEPPTVVGSHFR